LSRYLSEALGADEIKFNQAIMALEGQSGHYSQDIRLTSHLYQKLSQKIAQLNLDPRDTTTEELYYALNHKLAEDDRLLVKKIREIAAQEVNAEGNITDGLQSLILKLNLAKPCFALKASVLKKQLKALPPKKVMKVLNYRSASSMIRSEPVALIILAINYYESEAYIRHFYSFYKTLTAASFESRPLSFMAPKAKKWPSILKNIEQQTGLLLLSSYELATIIILPIKNKPKSGYLSALIANLLNETSIIYSASSFLKLHQVSKDFGAKLLELTEHEPQMKTALLDQPVTWEVAQDILKNTDHELFAPHLSSEDLQPENVFSKLGDILENLKFWSDSQILGLVESTETTSFNLLDVAGNVMNKRPFENRSLKHFKRALSSELAKLYLMPEQIVEELSAGSTKNDQSLAEYKTEAVY